MAACSVVSSARAVVHAASALAAGARVVVRAASASATVGERVAPCLTIALCTVAVLAAPVAAQSLPKVSFLRPDWTSEASFSQLTSLRELSNGNVIVADYQEVAVLLIGPNGKTISPIGRKGSGPAEYRLPTRVVALSNDTTLLEDRNARRFLLIDKSGRVIETSVLPSAVASAVEGLVGADGAGRLYFRTLIKNSNSGFPEPEGIGRWQRGTKRLDTLAVLTNPQMQDLAISSGESPFDAGTGVGFVRVRFGTADDWAVAPSGRVAIVRATPYRVDWLEKNRTTSTGAVVPYTPVPVTDQDKKLYEPKGPPFKRPYAKVKSPFATEYSLVDDAENVWVVRNEAAGAPTKRWDVFGPSGKYLGAVPLSNDRVLLAVTRRYAYVSRTDSDGLRWLERYSR